MEPVIRRDPSRQTETKTRFESFSAEDGVLRVTECYKLKAPRMQYGKCETELIRSRDTRSQKVFTALKIGYTDRDGEYPKSVSEILDEDELSSLSSALTYVVQNKSKLISTAKTYTEIKYNSRGGFVVGMYIADNKDTGEFIILEGETAFLVSLEDFQRLVDDALFTVETLRLE